MADDDAKALGAMTKKELAEAAEASINEADALRKLLDEARAGAEAGAPWQDGFRAACPPEVALDVGKMPSRRQAEAALVKLMTDATAQINVLARNLPDVPAHQALRDALEIYHDQINRVLYPPKRAAVGAE